MKNCKILIRIIFSPLLWFIRNALLYVVLFYGYMSLRSSSISGGVDSYVSFGIIVVLIVINIIQFIGFPIRMIDDRKSRKRHDAGHARG